MRKRKIIIPVVIAVTVIAAIGAYKVYQDQHSVVDVMPLSSLNVGYSGSDSDLYGTVYDSENQSVTLDGTATVSAVYVTQGQQVKAGDALLAYDISDLQLSFEMKKLALQQAQNQLQGAQSRLQILRNTRPVEPVQPTTPEPVPTVSPQPEKKDDKQQKNGLWTMVDALSDAYNASDEGAGKSSDNPLKFACTPDASISGKVINEAKKALSDEQTVYYLQFEGYQLDASETFDPGAALADKQTARWTIRVNAESEAEDDRTFSLMPFVKEKEEEKVEDPVVETPEPQPVEQDGYTAEELAAAIRQTQADIRNYDLDVRRKQLDLATGQKALNDGVVRAEKDGVVTKVGDPANPPQDGSAFLVVSSQGGTLIQGQISELMRDKLKPGDELNANDWNTGITYQAVVQSVDTVPISGNDNYYGGNPNASYYNFYALISDANDLTSYSGLSLSLPAMDDSTGYWIDNAYVRKDNGAYYVMKDDGNGRLKRQNVQVGATVWGSIINVKDGLSDEDELAFPYGKNVREGVRTQVSDGGMMG